MKVALWTLGLVLTGCLLKYAPVPYIWVGLVWTSLFGFFFVKAKNTTPKAVYFNIALFTIMLSAIEAYFWAFSPARNTVQEGNYFSHELFVKNDTLGYAPPPHITNAHGKVTQDGTLIYDMFFSTDEHGQRKSFKTPKAKESILFFGCSFTFGIGIQDNETLPYQTGLKISQFNTYNFAYGGYGPQQMLSAFEQGLVKKIVQEEPRFIFYIALPDHIQRAAGLTSWNKKDPRYETNEKGDVYFAGHFNDLGHQNSVWSTRIRAYMNKSYLLQKIFTKFIHIQSRPLNEQDLNRYINIVIKAKTIAKQDYPKASFHVILWDLYEDKTTQQYIDTMITQWQKNDLQVHLVSNILPGFYFGNPAYQIKGDAHPTPKANQLLATYISEKIYDCQQVAKK